MQPVIRDATPDDAGRISTIIISALRQTNARDYPAHIIAQVEHSFSPSAVLGLLAQRQVFVATLEGEVMATASLDRDTVRSVFVHPSSQGTGLGRQLMQCVEAKAAAAGVQRLRVPSSITAEGFYSALGFIRLREEFHGAERTIIMEKSMAGP